MVFTIYCCGTCSNSFDAHGDMERPADEWDGKPNAYEALWKAANGGDAQAKDRLRQILATRRRTVGLRNTFFEGEIVSTLAKNNTGSEYADWVLIDGPGSGNYQSKMLWTEPGDYSDTRGIATGAGMDENVRHALAILKNKIDPSLKTPLEDPMMGEIAPAPIERHGRNLGRDQRSSLARITPQALQKEIIRRRRPRRIPDQVNLIGWSRGAVTCIMIANAMAEDDQLRHVKVRIFAVDPVPGGVNQQVYSSMTRLPGSVKEYFGVYARDEVSRGFSPVIPKTNSSTQVTLLPMPGMHASVAGNSFLDKNAREDSPFNLQGPGRITRYWAERCLGRWGTPLKRTAVYSDDQLCNMYDEMVRNDPEFRKMQNFSYTRTRQGYRDTYRQVYIEGTGWMSNYWKFEELGGYNEDLKMMEQLKHRQFVNWHHMAVYKRAHRSAWRKLNRHY